MARSGKSSPSVLNWLGSLFLFCIPGVSLIFLILSLIFARSTAKRRFAVAGILLTVLFIVAVFAVFAIFPDYFTELAKNMRDMSNNIAITQGL